MTTPNIAAFLDVVSHSEGTDRPPAPLDPYRCVFGFGYVLQDLSNHPAITGEWKGATWGNGQFSTAAGRYQIIRATWWDAQSALSLPDFTGPSQDDAAVWLIKGKGALDLINQGQIEAALGRCSSIWASLPGSTSGQPQAKLTDLMDVYMQAGGAVA